MFKTFLMTLALAFAAPAAMAATPKPTDTQSETDMQTMQSYSDTTFETCARAAHEANRAYCEALGDNTQLPWEQAPEWQRESSRAGVRGVLIDGNTPEQSHVAWLKDKVANGWTFGLVKDPNRKTHPCLVPYEELSAAQRAKDEIFVSVTQAMAQALEPRVVPHPTVVEQVFEARTEAEAADIEPQLYGQIGYQAYAHSTGGKTFDGRDMPAWEALPERIQQAWADAASAIRGAV